MRARAPRRRAFSLVEMLIALTITSTLLTAALAALDASFKSYKFTTDGASTHVVSRIVMHRIMTMIRAGTDFAPYPTDPLDPDQNPVVSDEIEFLGAFPSVPGRVQTIRLELREAADPADGPNELWYIQREFDGADQVLNEERVILRGVQNLQFTLAYDDYGRLRRATVDITVRPNDVREATIHTSLDAPTIRFVSSVAPRRLNEDD